MSINIEWHIKNKMPKHPSLNDRLKWHEQHQKNCSCHPTLPPQIAEAIERRKALRK